MKLKVTQILIFACLMIYSCKKDKALEVLPTVETNDVIKIGVWSAESGGRITSEGSSKVIARGVCWSKNYPPTISDSKSYDIDNNGSFVSTLEGLVYATTYYVMAFAKNSSGFGYGEIKTFSTLGGKPVSETLPATNMGLNSVRVNSIVTANHYFAEVSFEWGLTTSYGNVTHPILRYVFGLTPTPVSAYIYGLTKGTEYHCRIKAVNQSGTTYGNDVTFTTTETIPASIIFNPDLIYGSVTDIDGNIYKTIKIGIQTWMAENLKTKRFNNGTIITRIEDSDYLLYSTENKPGYAWYNNDSATYYNVYGALYNWYAVDPAIRDVKNVCPVGWHVPGETEWNLLINYLGGYSSAGLKLKETTTAHWKSPAAVATNESGFSALPGGKDLYGDWQFYETTGFWWGSTINNGSYTPYCWSMYNESGEIIKNTEDKHIGLSVRCVKD